jgi:L-fucose isomerase-like protein
MARRFGILPVCAGPVDDEGALDSIVGAYLRVLEDAGGECRPANATPEDDDPLFVLVATGGTERAVLDAWAQRRGRASGEPLLLIAHPGNNSLPAALEVLARLQQDGTPGRIVYLQGPDDQVGLAEIAEAANDSAARRTLQRARIGLVGSPSDWLVASTPEAATVRKVWGPTVVPLDMEEVAVRLTAVSEAEVEALVCDLAAGALEVREPSTCDLEEVARVYLALKQLVVDHGLDAITVRCFDLVSTRRTTGCYGLAQLTDEGVIAGCEGDLVSTVGLLWARTLLGVTPWMANPAQVDAGADTLWLAHCTVPRSLVTGYRLRSHFESGFGVGIQGELPAGPATVLRIGGREMDRVWLAEGEITGSGRAEDLCRTQARVRLTDGGRVADLLRAPLGNHLVLVPGHHLDRLARWCRSAAISVLPDRTRPCAEGSS